jgi:hypothetical protein
MFVAEIWPLPGTQLRSILTYTSSQNKFWIARVSACKMNGWSREEKTGSDQQKFEFEMAAEIWRNLFALICPRSEKNTSFLSCFDK